MAEEIAAEISQTLEEDCKPEAVAGTESLQDMDLDAEVSPSESRALEKPNGNSIEDITDVSNPSAKRAREEVEEEAKGVEGDNAVSKKLKGEKSVEEKRLEEQEEEEDKGEEENPESEKEESKQDKTEQGKEYADAVNLGPMSFSSSVEMFDYFFKLLHFWQPNIDINEYEYMVLLDLLKKGHMEPEKKLGEGVHSFQVRFHPMWKSRCFFLVREDGFADDFSFRKCVDKILPLPDNMKASSNKDDGKKSGGHHKAGRGGHGGRGGRGRGKRGGFRN